MKYIIGIDIGGTTIKFGILNKNGEILFKEVIPTALDQEKINLDLINGIKSILNNNGIQLSEIIGIGIGCPGAINSKTGLVNFSNNIPLNNYPIVEELKKEFPVEIKVSNDANVAALGEVIFGAAKGYDNVVMFTLGTGVGGGIVIDKKLYDGNQGMGAELGHASLILGGEQCTCGRKGCVEAYVSATALIRQAKAAMQNNPNSILWKLVDGNLDKVNGKVIFDAAREHNDLVAKNVVETYLSYLSEAILDICNIFRPEAFVIGGGICAQGKFLTDFVEKYIKDRFYGYKGTPKVEILTAQLGNDAGIIGAASLIM